MKENTVFIKKIENAEHLGWAIDWNYKRSKELCNERINFYKIPRKENEIKDAGEILKSVGVKEFSISDRGDRLIPVIAEFSKFGYEISGLVKVYEDFLHEPVPAILLRAI